MLDDILKNATPFVVTLKEARVSLMKGETGARELPSMVIVYRGDVPVVQLHNARAHRDESLKLAHMAALGFDADALVHVADAWRTVGSYADANPITGRPWGPDEMQEAVEEHGALEQGWITECLVIHAVNRAGDCRVAVLPYMVKGCDVVWSEADPVVGTEEAAEGYIVRVLLEVMGMTSLGAQLAAMGVTYDAMGMGETEGRARADAVACTVITQEMPEVMIGLYCEHGSAREYVLREFLPDGEIIGTK